MEIAPLRTWLHDDHPRSHAEEAGMLQPGDDTRLLIASIAPADRPMIRADFASTEPVGYLTVPLGPTRERKLKLYLASGYKHVPRTPGYEKQFEGHAEE